MKTVTIGNPDGATIHLVHLSSRVKDRNHVIIECDFAQVAVMMSETLPQPPPAPPPPPPVTPPPPPPPPVTPPPPPTREAKTYLAAMKPTLKVYQAPDENEPVVGQIGYLAPIRVEVDERYVGWGQVIDPMVGWVKLNQLIEK